MPDAPGTTYPFLKGHGTRNDFVLLPDHDGSVHGDLDPARVRALCDRRGGIGADGVLRVVRSEGAKRRWFMDYRNADGSAAEMCGNGIRVFGLHLVQEGLVVEGEAVEVDTRDGVKTITVTGDQVSVDMGVPRVLGPTTVSVGDRSWPATQVDVGNPHAVAFVDDLADAGALLEAPSYDAGVYPDGVNVEFVVRRSEGHVAMRVHERGSGETMACGTGACAVAMAALGAEGVGTIRVDQPGGAVMITRSADGRVLMAGPALIVARGTTDL